MARREKAPFDELACRVAMEPSLPWDMALHMGMTSAPRISPTSTRSGLIRRAQRTRSAWVISPSPSMLGSRACMATASGWASRSRSRPSSKASSMVTRRSAGGISAHSARSMVVLPAPVPPVTRRFLRAATQAARNVGQPGIDGAEADQVGESDLHEPVAADGHARPSGHGHDREQPAAVRELQAQSGRGQVEAPLAEPDPGGQGPHQLDELGVARGDGSYLLATAVGVADEDLVGSVGVDVLDGGVLEVGLETGHGEEAGEDFGGDLVLGLRVEHGSAVPQRARSPRARAPRRSGIDRERHDPPRSGVGWPARRRGPLLTGRSVGVPPRTG